MNVGEGTPRDWTNGTGVFPAGGVISVPAYPYRQAIFVQNQDTTAVVMGITARYGSDGVTASIANVYIAPGASSGSQGGANQLGPVTLMITGPFTVTGTAGSKVCVLTN